MSNGAKLADYGFVPFFSRQTTQEEMAEGRIARVVAVHRSLIKVFDGVAEHSVPAPPYRPESGQTERPTVGDWLVLDAGRAKVERVLERKSLFKRVAAGEAADIQAIAANIDILFVLTSCNEEFNESRLERYLALAEEAGTLPVIVLTKADLAEDPDSYAMRARGMQPGVAVELVDARDSRSASGVLAWIEPGSTVALVGSSGVGKSTLVNTLAGADVAATGAIREDDKKGRHTTSHRALYRLPGGGLLVDVPGMRELKVAAVDAALDTVFDEIAARAAECRYADCRHESEPGCAVRDAIDRGVIDARRLANYRKLLRENERHTASLADRRAQGRAFARQVRQAQALKRRGEPPD